MIAQAGKTPDLWPVDRHAPYEPSPDANRPCACGKVEDARCMWRGEREYHTTAMCHVPEP